MKYTKNTWGQLKATIPASELWVFENKDTLDSIDKGMIASTKGQIINRGSFAKHVKDAEYHSLTSRYGI